MAGPEKNFENKVKKFLKDAGCYYVKFFANRNTQAGIPDLLCCIAGRFIAIEVKADNGHPSPLQLEHQREIRQADGICIILYPDQFDQFKEFVQLVNRVGYTPRGTAYRKQFEFDRDGQEVRKGE